MRLTLRYELPSIYMALTYRGQRVEVPDVLVDTGSATTVVDADLVRPIGIVGSNNDPIVSMQGAGGLDATFARTIDRIEVGPRILETFTITVGGMIYGRFEFGGILGMDFLRATGAILDLGRLELTFPD